MFQVSYTVIILIAKISKFKQSGKKSNLQSSESEASGIQKRSENSTRKPTKNAFNSITSNKVKDVPINQIHVHKFQEKIKEIMRLRKELKDDYIRSTTRRNVIPKWKDVIQLLQPIDIRLLLVAIKVLGDMYVEFDDYETARNLYSFYKIVSFRLELLEETMYSYEALGNVYKFLYQYHKAIKCYKKMIEMAWILNNRVAELRGYDHIGIQYFYLGNKEKAKYYHERMIYGLYEKETKIKESVVENFKNKHYQLFNDDRVLIKSNPTNEELSEQFIRHIMLYENAKAVINLETYDLLRNQDMMKNSFISDVDMSFQVIHEKYLSDDYLDDNSSKKEAIGYYDKYKKNMGFKKSLGLSKKNKNEKENLNQIDNLILSHLSTKRKDYNNERFEKIFQRFDQLFNEFVKKNADK